MLGGNDRRLIHGRLERPERPDRPDASGLGSGSGSSGAHIAAHIPTVFVLDWDGTIAGRVDFQSQRFALQQLLRKYGYRQPATATAAPAAFRPGHGLIRPGLVEFMKALSHMTDGRCFFFIYTASERKWATQEIQWVERTHNIRFARPIFARDDCVVDGGGNYRKSLKKIMPRILRIVTKQYPLTASERVHLVERRTICIDNNAVYLDRADRLLLCPDYGYMVFENLLDGLPPTALDHPVVQQHVLSLVNDGLCCPVPANRPVMSKLLEEYSWLARKCKTVMEANTQYEKDAFWKLLRKLIVKNNLRDWTASAIAQLQQLIWKRYAHSQEVRPQSGGAPLPAAPVRPLPQTRPAMPRVPAMRPAVHAANTANTAHTAHTANTAHAAQALAQSNNKVIAIRPSQPSTGSTGSTGPTI